MDHRVRPGFSMRLGTNEDPSQCIPILPGITAPAMPSWKSPSLPLEPQAMMPTAPLPPLGSSNGSSLSRMPTIVADASPMAGFGAPRAAAGLGSANPYPSNSGSIPLDARPGTSPYGSNSVGGGNSNNNSAQYLNNRSMEKRRRSLDGQASGASCISDSRGDDDVNRLSQQFSSSSINQKALQNLTNGSHDSGRSGASSRSMGLQGVASGDCRHFTPVQVYKATNNFNEANVLGHGAFGMVFKGKLLGCHVAVKRLEGGGWQGPVEYRTEVEVLSHVRHPNIVLLMGHCPEEHCLVYEFLPGGSLQDFLVPTRRRRNLTWADRTRVLWEIASALVYLHHHDPPIAHRDLKPDNVLLDANLTSKLGDVGLARLVVEDDSNVTARVRGTAGYIDPEEVITCEVSVLSDIYAFGLIALQLLMCEPNVKSVQKLLVECSNATGGAFGGRALSMSADVIMTKLDQSGGAWNPTIARQLVVMALKCADPKRMRRPDVAEELQPLLQRATEEAQAELQKQRQGLEAQLICPLLQAMMTDPVVAADGFTYERSAIETWLLMNDTSPSTGETMAHKFLTPNNGLKQLLS